MPDAIDDEAPLTGLAVLFICGIVMVVAGTPPWVISAVKTARRNGSD